MRMGEMDIFSTKVRRGEARMATTAAMPATFVVMVVINQSNVICKLFHPCAIN